MLSRVRGDGMSPAAMGKARRDRRVTKRTKETRRSHGEY